MILALAVSATLAGSVPTVPAAPAPAPVVENNSKLEPVASASTLVGHKKHRPERMYMTEMAKEQPHEDEGLGLLDIGISTILESVDFKVPKKMLGAMAGHLLGKFKNLDLKKVLKGALVVSVITVLGAVAAVAVAGLVSLVSGICAIFPHLRYFTGNSKSSADTQMDAITEFVMGALEKYEKHHKA